VGHGRLHAEGEQCSADFAKSSADGDPSVSRLTVRKRKSGVVLVKSATYVGEENDWRFTLIER